MYFPLMLSSAFGAWTRENASWADGNPEHVAESRLQVALGSSKGPGNNADEPAALDISFQRERDSRATVSGEFVWTDERSFLRRH
jgi:hypothetical protein